MNRFAAVTVTWILAQLFHPIVWLVLEKEFSVDDVSLIMVVSLIFSLPSYMCCLLLYPLVGSWQTARVWKAVGWLVVSQVGIVIGSFLAFLFVGQGIFFFDLTYPAHVSAALAAIVLGPFLFPKPCRPSRVDDFLNESIQE